MNMNMGMDVGMDVTMNMRSLTVKVAMNMHMNMAAGAARKARERWMGVRVVQVPHRGSLSILSCDCATGDVVVCCVINPAGVFQKA